MKRVSILSISFSTAGRVAFKVTITPSPTELSRLLEAVFKTEARLSHAEIVSKKEWTAVVWLKVNEVPKFELISRPKNFEFFATREVVI